MVILYKRIINRERGEVNLTEKREEILLDGNWKFAYTMNEPDLESEDFFPKRYQYEAEMKVPGYWDDHIKNLQHARFWSRDCKFNPDYRKIEFPMGGLKPPDASLPYLLGTGWYKRTFFATDDWKNSVVNLEVGGVVLEAWVWLNKEFVGHHLGHLTPFQFRLDSKVKIGEENELIIAVSNLRTDRTGCSIRGYKGKSAGITRSVKLYVTSKAQMTDCFVHTDESLKKLYWEVEVDRCADCKLELNWRIFDEVTETKIADGKEKSSDRFSWISDTFGMKCWSDRNPTLYRLEFELCCNGEVLDFRQQLFGLRHLKRDGIKILLNGNAVLLRGATEHAYFPETCTVSTEESYYHKTLSAMKKNGFNWLRFHTSTPPEECMIAADKLGMMLQVESPNGFLEKDFLDILKTCRKHPSVIMYCCGNEVPLNEQVIAQLKQMGEYTRRMAPDCLYNPIEALQSVEFFMDKDAEGYVEDPVPHNAKLLAEIKEFADVIAPAVWVFSYSALSPDNELVKKKLSIYERPCLIHEAGIFDSFLNLDLEKRYEGTRIGTDLFASARKYLQENGVLTNASTYYRNSCKSLSLTTKFCLEKARRSEYVAGYDFLGAIDCHWHRTGYGVGMLNEFYEPKVSFEPEECQKYNGESVVLADCGIHRNLISGTTIDIPLFVSLYGKAPADNVIITWYWKNELQQILHRNCRVVSRIERGGVTKLDDISVKAPVCKGKGEHFQLIVNVSGGEYELSNHWDYWVFHDEKMDKTENIRILTELADEDVEYMETGGKVLLLGSGPFPQLPTKFQIMSGGRVNGNCGTVIYEHPIFRNYPQDGFCDWQFEMMLENARAVVFNDLEIPFHPILEIISSYKLIRKQAAVFECRVGNGGLFVCGLNMDENNPAAVRLYNEIVRYISSENFKPTDQCSADYIRKLIVEKQILEIDFSTDECYDEGGQIEQWL